MSENPKINLFENLSKELLDEKEDIRHQISELKKKDDELSQNLDILGFFHQNDFTSLLDETKGVTERTKSILDVAGALIEHQLDKNPKEMDEREKEIWFASTSAKFKKINNMLDGIISEVNKMKAN